MVETGLARLRLAASVAFGAPVSVRSLDRLVEGAQASLHEYGTIARERANVVGAASIDPETRRQIAEQGLRKQGARAARETRYYAHLFERIGSDPSRVSLDRVEEVPITSKHTLREQPDAFVSRSAQPYLFALTTGTTGRPASVAYSRRELETFASMAALHGLVSGQLGPEDIVLVSISLRAALATTIAAAACARVGAACYLSGQIQPATTLQLLSEKRSLTGKRARPSILLCYASYLGELVEAGHSLGYRSHDFGLRSIRVGGEIVTAGLRARARALFGSVSFVQGYAATELDPLNATECSAGHLHFQPAAGLVEVRSLDGARSARPEEPGRIVATPFGPFRDTTLLLRYDTQDIARALPISLDCTLRDLPGISKPLGRLPLSVKHDNGWTFQREVIEALESAAAVPLPARYGFWRVPGGVAVEAAARSVGASTKRTVATALQNGGVPVREMHLVGDPSHLRRPLPVRGDLREGTFKQGAT